MTLLTPTKYFIDTIDATFSFHSEQFLPWSVLQAHEGNKPMVSGKDVVVWRYGRLVSCRVYSVSEYLPFSVWNKAHDGLLNSEKYSGELVLTQRSRPHIE